MKASIALLFLMQQAVFLVFMIPSNFIIPFVLEAIYIAVVLQRGLYRWYESEYRWIIFIHIVLCVVISALSVFAQSILQAGLMFIIMNLLFVFWIRVSKFWIHRQIEPLWTMVIGRSERLDKWMEEHRDIYDEAYAMDRAELGEVETNIELYRIPLILTDIRPSDELMELAGRLKVAVHYIADKDTDAPEHFRKNQKYKGLYVSNPV